MSLINEALKKAQRQRIDPAEPTINIATTLADDGAPAPRIAKRRPPMPARTWVVLLIGGWLLLVAGGALTFVLLHLNSAHPLVAKAAPVAARPAAATASPVHIAAAPPPLTSPAPAKVAPTPETTIFPYPAETSPKPVSNPAVYVFLEALRISGVRMSGKDSKVIINDRIVRVNDYVDRTLGLRLTSVTPSGLIFTDEGGFEYTKGL